MTPFDTALDMIGGVLTLWLLIAGATTLVTLALHSKSSRVTFHHARFLKGTIYASVAALVAGWAAYWIWAAWPDFLGGILIAILPFGLIVVCVHAAFCGMRVASAAARASDVRKNSRVAISAFVAALLATAVACFWRPAGLLVVVLTTSAFIVALARFPVWKGLAFLSAGLILAAFASLIVRLFGIQSLARHVVHLIAAGGAVLLCSVLSWREGGSR